MIYFTFKVLRSRYPFSELTMKGKFAENFPSVAKLVKKKFLLRIRPIFRRISKKIESFLYIRPTFLQWLNRPLTAGKESLRGQKPGCPGRSDTSSPPLNRSNSERPSSYQRPQRVSRENTQNGSGIRNRPKTGQFPLSTGGPESSGHPSSSLSPSISSGSSGQ